MKKFYSITGSIAFVTLMGSTAAFAEISASEAWADYRSDLAASGYKIAGDEAMSGDTLTISNLSVKMAAEGDAPGVSMEIGTLGFTEVGDGTVSVEFPASFPFIIAKEDDFKVVLTYSQDNQRIIASGMANDITYTYSADSIDLALSELVANGKPMADVMGLISVKDLTGSSRNQTGELRTITSAVTTGEVTYKFRLIDRLRSEDVMSLPEGVISLNGGMASLTMNADGVFPMMPDYTDMAKMMADGFEFNFDMAWGKGGFDFSFSERGKKTAIASQSSGGNLAMDMNAESISYGLGAQGAKASVQTPDLPFPVDYEFGELQANMAMPIRKSETPSDFSTLIKLVDFNTSDLIWGLGDPSGALPHDPATIILDLSGKVQLLVDLMDAEVMSQTDQPGLLHALTLKALQLKIAGAELTGNGAFTFDNNDMETFPYFPRPDGTLDLKLVGGNGLLDKLIQMGLVQEDQAMGARLMMGLIAQRGEGEDTLTSKIEVKDGGQVYANGQRLK